MIEFDIQTIKKAKQLIRDLASSSSHKKMNEDAIADTLKENGVLLKCRHFTTALDECNRIKMRGLESWSSVLVDKTAFLTIALERGGIAYSADKGFDFFRYDFTSVMDSKELNYYIRHLEMDDCISAYLYCGRNDEGYSCSPEILRMFAYYLKDGALEQEKTKWEKSAKSYCITFHVSIDDVDVLSDYYSATEDGQNEVYNCLAKMLLDVASCETSPINKQIVLKKGVTIRPDQLQIEEANESLWDCPF